MKARRILFVVILAALLVSACQSDPEVDGQTVGLTGRSENTGAYPAATEMPVVVTEMVTEMRETVVETQVVQVVLRPEAEEAMPYPVSAPVSSAGSPPAAGRMVIKDAQIRLSVADTDRAIERLNSLAADYGGYLISSESWYEGEYKAADLRLAVPSLQFENVLNQLRDLGERVLAETASGQDVSAEYVDLQSRLTNLEATATRVRAFLEDAQTVEEALQVNNQLSQLEAQIEGVKGQMHYYEGRTAYSTISVSLEQVRPTPTVVPTAMPPTGWSPGETFEDAAEVFVVLARSAVDASIWALVLGGPLVLLVGLAWLLLRFVASRLRGRKSIGQA